MAVRPMRELEWNLALGLHSVAGGSGVTSRSILCRSAVMQALHHIVMQICNLLSCGSPWLELSGSPTIGEAVLECDTLTHNGRRNPTTLPSDHRNRLIYHAASDGRGVQHNAMGPAG